MKLLQVRVTEDEHKRIEQKVIELSVQEGKLLSMTAGLRVILMECLNGNNPEIPSTEESKESVENVDGEQKTFDGVNMDF